jgi:hypothetical protein
LIGAGLAALCLCSALQEAGVNFQLVEAATIQRIVGFLKSVLL